MGHRQLMLLLIFLERVRLFFNLFYLGKNTRAPLSSERRHIIGGHEMKKMRKRNKKVESMFQKRMKITFSAFNRSQKNPTIWKPENREGATLLVIKWVSKRKEAVMFNRPFNSKEIESMTKITFLNKKNNLEKKKFCLLYLGGFGVSVYNDINIYQFGIIFLYNF